MKGKWTLIYKKPKHDGWACNVMAKCSCCGEPLRTFGNKIGFGNDKDTGETIIWSGFITNWKEHQEQARLFALDAAESMPDELFPHFCENCGAAMEEKEGGIMTNGDNVRRMTNSDLEELWSTDSFDEKFRPECSKNEEGCRYFNFTCNLCPATFRNWLDAEVEK